MNVDQKQKSLDFSIKDIGATLKSERKARGYSIEDISEKTRIPKSFIISLENNEFNKLPGIGYIPGFIRNYCKAIKIDPSNFIKSFKSSVAISEEKPIYNFPVQALVPKLPGSTIAMFSVLLVLVGYISWTLYKNKDFDEALLTADNLSYDAKKVETETKLKIIKNKEKIESFEKNFIPEIDKLDEKYDYVSNNELAKLFNMNENSKSIFQSPNINKNNFNNLNNNSTESKIRSSSAQATARLPKKEIIIKANSTSWVEITKSNGEIILSKLMRKGDVVDTIANENYYFSTGNAGALTLETPSITPFKLGKIGEILRDLPLNLEVISVRKSLIEN